MNLRGIKYVVKRGDAFQLRLPIPKDLQERVGRKELRWSLGTENRRIAAQRAFRAGVAFLELCDTLRRTENIFENKIKRMVQVFYVSLRDAYVGEKAVSAVGLENEIAYERAAAADGLAVMCRPFQSGAC